ncbi:hypothetical protein [Sporomusa sp.]|uniref:hypothetical protein n=1 Tax=Sporomusa sp. TaxID=2078658 RepID=UPI002D0317CD|nr:hypothetical protein [Sporomusa sp.]HWR05262.1 hypothetical protein [Sporomusa sp.]
MDTIAVNDDYVRRGPVDASILEKLDKIEATIKNQNRSVNIPSSPDEKLINNLVLKLGDKIDALDQRIDKRIDNLDIKVTKLNDDITQIKIDVGALKINQTETKTRSEAKGTKDRWRYSIIAVIGVGLVKLLFDFVVK